MDTRVEGVGDGTERVEAYRLNEDRRRGTRGATGRVDRRTGDVSSWATRWGTGGIRVQVS